MNIIPSRKRTSLEWVSRGSESGPAYAEYLRERFPMGSVVAINLVTGKYVVGGASPQALYMYWDKFGKKAEPNMWLDEPIHWSNTRPRDEEIAEMAEWFKERRRSRRKRC